MTFNTSVILFEVNEIKSILGFLFVFFKDKWACDIPCTSYCPVYTKPNEFMVAVDFAHELVTMKLSFLFTELIKCKCISKKDFKKQDKKRKKEKTLEYAFNCSVSMKSWLSHTLCIPRNETQRTCSIFVTLIVCFRDSTVHSFLCLYTFFFFFWLLI